MTVAVGALLASAAKESGAAQFVLLDATFDYTWQDAMNAKPNKSHFYVNEGNFLNKTRPPNWLSPIDYRNGTLHVRAEVFKKPAGTQTTGWTLCYIANAGGYGCADTDYYRSTGIFEREVKMTDFWNNNQVQWDKGVKQIDLIYAIDDSGSGHVTNYPELKDLTTPTRVRITMVQVSAGSSYDPNLVPGLPTDGGSPQSGDGDPVDAVTTVDVAGSGSGGGGGATVTGSGGASTAPPSSTGGASGTTTGAGGSGSGGATPPPAGSVSAGGSCALSLSDRDDGRGALIIGCLLGVAIVVRRRHR